MSAKEAKKELFSDDEEPAGPELTINKNFADKFEF